MKLRTSEVSGLPISVYYDIDPINRAPALRDNQHNNKDLADIFANEGTVGVFSLKEEQLGHLLKSRS